MDPKLYLAIDNCFAQRRWTEPLSWMKVIKDLGVYYVEASADTECDPLYMGMEFMEDWVKDVKRASEKTGVSVRNLYSGHGTYATLGLTHYDERVRRRFCDKWMKPQENIAKAVGAGFGFAAHAFDDACLQDKKEYQSMMAVLYDLLAEIGAHAKEIEMGFVGLEQMYTPHMPPWTVDGARELLAQVYARGKAPFYLTIDLGHMNGQQYFQWPVEAYIREMIDQSKTGRPPKRVWMGRKKAMRAYLDACEGDMSLDAAVELILCDAKDHPYLFAKPEDGDIYRWIEELAPWSPIIHLQQSDGKTSPHWCFDAEHNKMGVVEGERVMQSLKKAFEKNLTGDLATLPPACDTIIMTLEPFVGTMGNNYAALEEIRESVAYWRKFIPRDGMRLSEAHALLNLS